MRARLIEKIEFKRGGDPREKLRIGHSWKHSIKKALLRSVDEIQPEAVNEFLEKNTRLAEELEYQSGDMKDAENILMFDEDWYMEYHDILFKEFAKMKSEFIEAGELIRTEGEVSFIKGRLRDGSKVYYYHGGLISGYITRREWLK